MFYWYWTKISNCRDLNIEDASSFPINESILHDEQILNLHKKLMKDFKGNALEKIRVQKKTGEVRYLEFYPVKSKDIINRIDELLSKHFKLSEIEKDFIINYDLKYRMSKELDCDEEE